MTAATDRSPAGHETPANRETPTDHEPDPTTGTGPRDGAAATPSGQPGVPPAPRTTGKRRRGLIAAVRGRQGLAVTVTIVVLATLAALIALAWRFDAARWNLLRIYCITVLAAFPGLLYARFLRTRADAVWADFVLNLHRLQMDEPWFLPEPIRASIYHREWEQQPGAPHRDDDTIYGKKYESIHGCIPRAGRRSSTARPQHMLPVYAVALTFGVLWSVVLWGAAPAARARAELSTLTALAITFMGAYGFAVLMLVRRYFEGDLRTATYSGILARIMFVLPMAYVIHQIGVDRWNAGAEAAMLFLVGFFPMTGLHLLRAAAGRILQWVPDVDDRYPLNRLDGMTIWYEALLDEVGIADLQHMATANIVDVMLTTRIPVARLVDWINQAILMLHLDSTNGGRKERGRTAAAHQAWSDLRRHGIRTATDLLDVLDAKPDGHLTELDDLLAHDRGRPSTIRCIRETLRNEPNLAHVIAWERWESRTHRHRRPHANRPDQIAGDAAGR